MIREQAAAIVPLIEEQSDGITLLEAQFVVDAILPDRERLRRGFAGQTLRRRLRHAASAHLAGENFVISAAYAETFRQPLQFLLLCRAQRLVRLRKHEFAKP